MDEMLQEHGTGLSQSRAERDALSGHVSLVFLLWWMDGSQGGADRAKRRLACLLSVLLLLRDRRPMGML